MPDEHTGGTTLIPLFDRLAAGDTSAADEIITHSIERLRRLAHKRMKSFLAVRQRHETDDVVQGAALRLHRALKAIRPTSVEQFTRLAATQIRRELLDLKRHEFGVNEDRVQVVFGPGGSTSEANHILDGRTKDAKEKERRRQLKEEIDELVEHLPEEERVVFEQIRYQGFTHEEVAHALGVSESTVDRHFCKAKILLRKLLKRNA
jgi:RNA polymerase sigma factor (sigma-70 family)